MASSYRDDQQRARRGGGTRRERRPGVWEIRVPVGVDATGRGLQRSWTVHGDDAHAAAVQADLVEQYGVRRVGCRDDGESLSVAELLERFVGSPHVWSPKTVAVYRSHARYVAKDPVGRVRLGHLSPAAMERAVARWVAAGIGPAVVLGRWRVLHSAITWALHEQLLRFDPLTGFRSPPASPPRKHLPPRRGRQLIAEADRVVDKARAAAEEHPRTPSARLAWFRAEQTALLLRLVADTGVRLGELTALRTDDLDDGVLTIERAAKDGGNIGPTKTHRRRSLTLGRSAAKAWAEHIAAWKPEAVEGAERWLFTSRPDSSVPLTPSGVAQRFTRLRDGTEIIDATLHRFRHTVGTYLVRQGELSQATKRLGHDSAATTLRYYHDLDGLDDRVAADALERLYNDPPT